MQTQAYLGDGVYASFDGHMVTLKTEEPRLHVNNTIYLEPSVLRALIDWQKSGFRDHTSGRTFYDTIAGREGSGND